MKPARLVLTLAGLGLALLAGATAAQTWPTKPVRIIITFAPGGSSDVVARLISGPLQSKLGQTVIVDNKPGGGGTIGAAEAALTEVFAITRLRLDVMFAPAAQRVGT